jgi:DNA polymerase III sliding clamp (beta) subunit (PCNA family)
MPASTETEVQDTHVKFSCTVKYLDTFIDSVASFRDEGKLVFTGDNIYTKVADPANVGMCIAKIKGQALNSLQVKGDDQIIAALRFEKILDCLSGISGTSDVEVTWPVMSSGTRLVRLDIIDEDIQFEINTLDTGSVADIPDIDPLSHKSRVTVDGSKLKKTVGHAKKMVSQDDAGIYFETFGETLQVSTSDKSSGSFKKQFHNHDPSVDQDLGEHQTTISVDYLDDIKNILSEGSAVTVHVKQDNPVRFDVNLDDNGDAKVIYIIAPRLSDG